MSWSVVRGVFATGTLDFIKPFLVASKLEKLSLFTADTALSSDVIDAKTSVFELFKDP